MDASKLKQMAFLLAAMRNQVDALMTLLGEEMVTESTPAKGNDNDLGASEKARSYFGGRRESPATSHEETRI